jgi:hypothetical protein
MSRSGVELPPRAKDFQDLQSAAADLNMNFTDDNPSVPTKSMSGLLPLVRGDKK